ncbi:MAG: tetratricopeptide repeat protein [Gemmatimonadota bacterium]
MTQNSLESLTAERARLTEQLHGNLTVAERLALKDAIVALFRRSEASITELEAFKESIRGLIDQFKGLPMPIGGGKSVRHDHIGASTSVERGWSALAAGEWVRAEELLLEAITRDAHHADAQALLGWALMHQGRGDEALQRCLEVLVRHPDHGLARTAIGAICLQKGITGEAMEHLGRAVRLTSDPRATLYAQYWLGVAYLTRDMLTEAVEVLHRAVQLGPNLAEGWAELGRAQWRGGDRTGAITAWHTASAIRHSPFAARAADLLARVNRGEEIPRSPLD